MSDGRVAYERPGFRLTAPHESLLFPPRRLSLRLQPLTPADAGTIRNEEDDRDTDQVEKRLVIWLMISMAAGNRKGG